MIGRISKLACAAAIVCACATGALATSAAYQGVSPWTASDIPAGWPGAFDVTGSGNILVLSGLNVNELSPAGAFLRTIGPVPNYDNGSK